MDAIPKSRVIRLSGRYTLIWVNCMCHNKPEAACHLAGIANVQKQSLRAIGGKLKRIVSPVKQILLYNVWPELPGSDA